MAKKSMIAKCNRPAKFSSREYTRCARCGRPHSVYVVDVRTQFTVNSTYAGFAYENLPTRDKFLV